MHKKSKIFTIVLLIILIISSIILVSWLNTQSANKSTSFSITYTDTFGYESQVTSIPQRIISLSPNTTEILCSLGLENKLVGRTDYCDYPETLSSIASVGTITEPNLEVITSLNPDIIITDGMQSQEVIASIRNLGYTVIITRSNQSLDGTYDIISDIGLVTNTSKKATEIINNMKENIDKIKKAISSIENKKTVYYSVSLSDYGLYTAGANTYIDELLKTVGLINIATDMDGWTYSVENLIKHDPDYIICSNLDDSRKTILDYSPISSLTAVKNDSIIEIDVNLIERQGPRNIEGLKILLSKIYNINID